MSFVSIEKTLIDADHSATKHLIKEFMDHTTCPVCQDHMFVPFITSCGHNFCYECLVSWLEEHETCPTCRHLLTELPVLNMVVQQLARSLYNTTLTLVEPPVELIQEKKRKEEQYQRDLKRNNLFKKIFSQRTHAIRDEDDHVERCGNCNWELSGNVCGHCGFRVQRSNGLYHDIEMEDETMDDVREMINEHGTAEQWASLSEQSSDLEFLDDREIEQIEHFEDDLSSDESSRSSSPVRTRRRYQSAFIVEDERRLALESDSETIPSWNGFDEIDTILDEVEELYSDSSREGEVRTRRLSRQAEERPRRLRMRVIESDED